MDGVDTLQVAEPLHSVSDSPVKINLKHRQPEMSMNQKNSGQWGLKKSIKVV